MNHLPGFELIQRGITDYAAGQVSPESCLLAIAWSRLQRGGLKMPTKTPDRFPEPEIQLYALLRRLISFEQSLEHQKAASLL